MGISSLLLGLLSTSWLNLLPNLRLNAHTQSNDLDASNSIVPRKAVLADMDDVTDVYIAAFEPNAMEQYTYQFRHRYPVYHYECLREQFVQAMELSANSQNIAINVIDQSDDDKSGLTSLSTTKPRRVVSFAFWALLPVPESEGLSSTPHLNAYSFPFTNPTHLRNANTHDRPQFDCSQQLDQNITRATYVDAQLDAALGKLYTPSTHRLYLALLATHPDWDGHGFAAAHLQWGLDWARREMVNTTLEATPAGHLLYRSVGFEELVNVTVDSLPGDVEGPFWLEAMYHLP